ncbi:hypothetical protein BR63_01860 [Thermanaerosceptrum fracticalcis]|uniref:Uncharacterized protein n=1 Tax=Thermanaerosceptrum fracticalcis TaxID=1712410 RepID=A0A7G6DZC0_THEFR|nr:hypothetical protein [Thermanaerosceptrum fracticalcis]QNB45174.1 hypothetical protein BR63_01860 [Thermanaerosceptrum fracticalcis]
MKKKIATQLLVFCLLFITWWEVHTRINYEPTGKITGPLPVFPTIQMELLQSGNPHMVEDALDATVKTLVKYIKPGLLNEAWQVSYLFLDLIPGAYPEVIVTLSLAPDKGILAIIQRQNNNYILLTYLDNLLPLGKLDKLSLANGKEILVTREDHDEMTGAFTRVCTVKLWGWQENTLHVLWSENSHWEINWLNTWQNPKANPVKWLKLTQDLRITYETKDSSALIKTTGQQNYYISAQNKVRLPPETDFSLLQSRELTETYYWHEKWQKFVLNTGVIDIPGKTETQKRVAVLKNMANHLENLPGGGKQLLEVIDDQGKIFLVEKSLLKLDT